MKKYFPLLLAVVIFFGLGFKVVRTNIDTEKPITIGAELDTNKCPEELKTVSTELDKIQKNIDDLRKKLVYSYRNHCKMGLFSEDEQKECDVVAEDI